MDKITKEKLEYLVDHVNVWLGKGHLNDMTRHEEENTRYHLCWCNGGVALRTPCEEDGALLIQFRGSKRELYERIKAFMSGIYEYTNVHDIRN